MDKKFLRAKELAQLWNITTRRINQLCVSGLLPGSYKAGKFWMIPSDVEKPSVLRTRQTTTSAPASANRLLPCPVGITTYKESIP